jgi:hypothetical protein
MRFVLLYESIFSSQEVEEIGNLRSLAESIMAKSLPALRFVMAFGKVI